MGNTNISPLFTPQELKLELPATLAQLHFIEQARNDISKILNGEDPRLLLIIGPCSIHDLSAAKHYATLLAELREEVKQEFFIVMRAHFEKPRSSLGWKGLVYDPQLDGTHDMATGLRWSRELLLELAHQRIPAATEILDPLAFSYFEDMIAWGCIGARTASSQIHRQMASGLGIPIAFKNNTDGNIDVAINGALVSSQPHVYMGIDENGAVCMHRSKGNSHAHIVLRGGAYKPNYDSESIHHTASLQKAAGLPSAILIDCSHDNSRRNYKRQTEVFDDVLSQVIAGNKHIRGFVLESNLDAGRQALGVKPSQLRYGVSVTDPCLDWDSTAILIKKASKKLKASSNESVQAPHTAQEVLSI